MSEYWLIVGLVTCALLGGLLLVYPLRGQKILSSCLFLVVGLVLFLAYGLWGSLPEWQMYRHKQESELAAKAMLQSIKNPQELIDKLQARLNDSPESAKGWYLLGRLYSSQNALNKASEAFAKAYKLKPHEEQFAVNYAHSLWLVNHQQFNPKILSILENLLAANPKQPDALAMMAMHFFINKDKDKARSYWFRLLKLVPAKSQEAEAIRKALML